jgi:hypothetical protein
MTQDMLSVLIALTREVSETMAFRPLGSQTLIDGDAAASSASAVGTTAFPGFAGEGIPRSRSIETAWAIAGAMLDIPAAQVNGEMPEAVGEITHMMAGTLHAKMLADDCWWAISVPSVTIDPAFLCSFTLGEGEEPFVDLMLTEN